MNSPESRKEYGMKTKYRLMPRSFGKYSLLNKDFTAIEFEEICIENNTLTLEEYLYCREIDLSVELLHNMQLFSELQQLCQWLDYPWFQMIRNFHERGAMCDEGISELYRRFRSDALVGLWDTSSDLRLEVGDHIEDYLSSYDGTNEMATAKATGFFNLQEQIHGVVFSEMAAIIDQRGLYDEVMQLFLKELKEYSFIRKNGLLDTSLRVEREFHFDFISMSQNQFESPERYFVDEGMTFVFEHSAEQKQMIGSYVKQYGTCLDGLGRICMRAPLDRLYRQSRVERKLNKLC